MFTFLLILLAFAFWVMNSEERRRFLRPALGAVRRLLGGAILLLRGSRRVSQGARARKPWALATLGIAAAFALTGAVRMAYVRPLTDVRPEIERLIAIEQRTAQAYEAAVGQFKLGAISADGLARVIERRVMPELRLTYSRLKAVEAVAAEQRSVIERAQEYLRLRDQSWRLRAEALQKRNMAALRRADTAERASLDAFEKVRSIDWQ